MKPRLDRLRLVAAAAAMICLPPAALAALPPRIVERPQLVERNCTGRLTVLFITGRDAAGCLSYSSIR